jgi:hypothetical protein
MSSPSQDARCEYGLSGWSILTAGRANCTLRRPGGVEAPVGGGCGAASPVLRRGESTEVLCELPEPEALPIRWEVGSVDFAPVGLTCPAAIESVGRLDLRLPLNAIEPGETGLTDSPFCKLPAGETRPGRSPFVMLGASPLAGESGRVPPGVWAGDAVRVVSCCLRTSLFLTAGARTVPIRTEDRVREAFDWAETGSSFGPRVISPSASGATE